MTLPRLSTSALQRTLRARHQGDHVSTKRCLPRSAVIHGVWLCQTCAKLVDNDPSQFPESVLRARKTLAEHKASSSVGKTAVNIHKSESERYPELRLTCSSQARNAGFHLNHSGGPEATNIVIADITIPIHQRDLLAREEMRTAYPIESVFEPSNVWTIRFGHIGDMASGSSQVLSWHIENIGALQRNDLEYVFWHSADEGFGEVDYPLTIRFRSEGNNEWEREYGLFFSRAAKALRLESRGGIRRVMQQS
jgi:hypothetical protein